MKSTIKLVKYVADYKFNPDSNRGWGLMVRATGENIDSEVFVYHRMQGIDPYEGDLFEAVASVNQYYEIPKYAPKEVSQEELIPYYRRNQLEVFARSPEEREEIWEYIKLDVARLISDYNSYISMKSHSTVSISGKEYEEVNATDFSEVLEIEWSPCGNWNGSTITDPDSSKKGWLPLSEIDNVISGASARIPENAMWFYNGSQDQEFSEALSKFSEPYDQNLMDINGVYLMFGSGGAYEITSDGLYWMENANHSIEGLQKNPWPDDYIDGIEVSDPPSIRLSVPLTS